MAVTVGVKPTIDRVIAVVAGAGVRQVDEAVAGKLTEFLAAKKHIIMPKNPSKDFRKRFEMRASGWSLLSNALIVTMYEIACDEGVSPKTALFTLFENILLESPQ